MLFRSAEPPGKPVPYSLPSYCPKGKQQTGPLTSHCLPHYQGPSGQGLLVIEADWSGRPEPQKSTSSLITFKTPKYSKLGFLQIALKKSFLYFSVVWHLSPPSNFPLITKKWGWGGERIKSHVYLTSLMI